MDCKGTVIRSIDLLDIGESAKAVAKELAEQIDMPVVFLIDPELDRNYAGRNECHHNQFWVTASHQAEQSEYERIILSNLYRGIYERKRILRPVRSETYFQKLRRIQDPTHRCKRIELYHEVLGKILSIVTTIDAEQHLKRKGFMVSQRRMQKQYNNRIRLLDDYLQKQQAIPGFTWYYELSVVNLLDYFRIAGWNEAYFRGIRDRLSRIRPRILAQKYVNQLTQLVEMVKEANAQYEQELRDEIMDWMVQRIIAIMHLEDMVLLERQYATNGSFRLEDGETAPVYSFVPEDVPDEKLYIEAIRHINQGILLLQEFNATFSNKLFPDVHVNLILHSRRNAYANKVPGKGYYFSFTTGALRFLNEQAQKCSLDSLPKETVLLCGEEEVRRRLYRYMLFYIAAHEYAHVLNGDCDRAAGNMIGWHHVDWEKETKADNWAKEMVRKVLAFQYRPDPNQDIHRQQWQFMADHTSDQLIFIRSCEICDEVFRNLNIR